MAEHTPEPWVAGNTINNDGEEVWDVVAESIDSTTLIAECGSTKYPECEANAHLIASAPDLLRACKEVNEWYDLVKQNYPDMAGLLRGMEAGRTAITTVKGA